MKGTVQILDIPADEELKNLTEKVISNNFTFEKASNEKFESRKTNPIPLFPGEKVSPVKHIVFISIPLHSQRFSSAIIFPVSP